MTDRLLRVATVQFEAVDRDKAANLAKIDALATKAASEERAGLVCFHECCIPGVSVVLFLLWDNNRTHTNNGVCAIGLA